jgi:magnesium chelatase family protein
MLSRIQSASLLGIDAFPVEVEVDISNGLPSFSTVGLPNGAVKEGRERVSAALANAGYQLPLRRITVNLAPADVRKDGSALDLPIALGLLLASGQLPDANLDGTMVLGEVGLEGDLRPIRGALSMALADCYCRRTICPKPGSFKAWKFGVPERWSKPAPTCSAAARSRLPSSI